MRITLRRVNESCHFEATNEEGLSVQLDASPEALGSGQGVRPMQTLLMALGGCTAIDVTLILTKQKLILDHFILTIEGHREKQKEPSLWQAIHIEYTMGGLFEKEKAVRAIELSLKKYCSVAETLRRAGASITYDLLFNDRSNVIEP